MNQQTTSNSSSNSVPQRKDAPRNEKEQKLYDDLASCLEEDNLYLDKSNQCLYYAKCGHNAVRGEQLCSYHKHSNPEINAQRQAVKAALRRKKYMAECMFRRYQYQMEERAHIEDLMQLGANANCIAQNNLELHRMRRAAGLPSMAPRPAITAPPSPPPASSSQTSSSSSSSSSSGSMSP